MPRRKMDEAGHALQPLTARVRHHSLRGGFEPHAPHHASRRASFGPEWLKLHIELQSREEADRPWLPEVIESISIDQGPGERRYNLRSTLADGAGSAGQLRCLYSVKDCGDKRTGSGAQASMVTLIWSPPSSLRGVPLRDLKHYWQCQKKSRSELSSSANMYEAVEHSILPSTAAAQSSLAELLDFGPAETFVSHWWGSKVESTLEALEKHCEGHDTVRVWICSVANNQRRITEELGSDIDGSSFSQALHSKHCRAMALMLDDGCETLKRIWCLYEVLCVILMRDNHDHDQIPIEFDLCTSQGILNRGNLHTQAMEIGELVSAIDVAHAQCSNPQDKVLIDAAIQLHLGGHEQMNCRIREAVDQSLEKTQAAYYARIMRVRANLFTASGPDVSDHWRTAQDAVFFDAWNYARRRAFGQGARKEPAVGGGKWSPARGYEEDAAGCSRKYQTSGGECSLEGASEKTAIRNEEQGQMLVLAQEEFL